MVKEDQRKTWKIIQRKEEKGRIANIRKYTHKKKNDKRERENIEDYINGGTGEYAHKYLQIHNKQKKRERRKKIIVNTFVL